jgi:predicted nucleotidyltransferase
LIRLFQEARSVQETLNTKRWPFCFIGGIAVQHWGEPRATRDLDLSIFTGFGGEAPVVDGLLAEYAGRIADARDFALRHRVLLIRTASGVEVDVALAGLPFESEMINRAIDVELETDVVLRLCRAEDLFVLKAFADRAQDRADLVGIARRRGAEMDWTAVVERLTPLAEAKDALDILDRVRDLQQEFGPKSN